MPRIVSADNKTIIEAASALKNGQLVAIPTETVYGLAANAQNNEAIGQIFTAKNRPAHNPLIVHILDLQDAANYVEITHEARALAAAFWPGPLTMILPQKPDNGIADLCTAGLKTLAVRAPSHPITRALLREVKVPLAAPSANKSGTLSPTTPAHVANAFGDEVAMILAAGASDVGLESTVIDLSGTKPALVRHGGITLDNLKQTLEVDIEDRTAPTDKPVSPGQLLKHYAPQTPLRLRATSVKDGEALLAFGSIKFMALDTGGSAKNLPDTHLKNLSEDGDLNEAASNLFRMLHDLDKSGASSIAVMDIPNNGVGIAINDRLRRATASQD